MMNPEKSEALYKFRVTGTDGKPFVIFNGVSANSWLSPVGIKLNQEDKEQIKLPQRPKSSGSIMIIRHHPSPKGLNRDEMIHGVRIDRRVGEEKPEERPRPCSELARPSCSSNTQRGGMRLTSAGRPHTAVGDRVLKRQPLQRKSENYEHPNLELTIQSLELRKTIKLNASETASITDRREFVSANRLHSALVSKNIYGSHMFAQRAKSAPPNVRSDTTKPALSKRGPALYWRAKSAYHRKMLVTSADMDWDATDGSSQSYKGSLLRPLMYCEDGELKHSAGCPYKCKGCFRACLVSKDYLEKMKRKKDAPPRKSIKQRPMVKKDARFVMHMALARNQPIYKIVHGDECSRTEAWAEEPSKDSTTSETGSFNTGEHLTNSVPLQDRIMQLGEYNIQDAIEKEMTSEEREVISDKLCVNRSNSLTHRHVHVNVENMKHSAQIQLIECNTTSTKDEYNKNVSSDNGDTGHIATERTNRKLSRGSHKHCSFDNTLPTVIGPLATEHMDSQSDPSTSYSVSPVKKAIRTLYETESRTSPEVARSECSEKSESCSKKSEAFSRISVKSEVYSEGNELLDDSLTDESTISLGMPSDDDAETQEDSSSTGTDKTSDSNRETSISLESTETPSECSLCGLNKQHNQERNNGKGITSRRISTNARSKHNNKTNNDTNTVDPKDSQLVGNDDVDGSDDDGVKHRRSFDRHNKASRDNKTVADYSDDFDNDVDDDRYNSTCVKEEADGDRRNDIINETGDSEIGGDNEPTDLVSKNDGVKRQMYKMKVTKKKRKQRNKKMYDKDKDDEGKRKVSKKAKTTGDKGDTNEDDSDVDVNVNSSEEDSGDSHTAGNASEGNNDDSDTECNKEADDDSDTECNKEDSGSSDVECSKEESGDSDTADNVSEGNNDDSDTECNKEHTDDSDAECSKEESVDSDTADNVSEVDKNGSETDYNNNEDFDTEDNQNENGDSDSDGDVDEDRDSNTEDDVSNEDNKNSDTDDNVNKDGSDSEDSVNTEDNVNTEDKDVPDTEDTVSKEDECDSYTEEHVNKSENGDSDAEDNANKEDEHSDTEDNDTDDNVNKEGKDECDAVDDDSDVDDDDADEESDDSVVNESSGEDDDDDSDGSKDDSDDDNSSNNTDIRVVKSRRR